MNLLTGYLAPVIAGGLVFLGDQDARPPGAAEPRASLWDNGADPVEASAPRDAALAETRIALADDGSFVTYQMFYLPRRRLRAHLERCFRLVRTELDLRNLPPQRIYQAVK